MATYSSNATAAACSSSFFRISSASFLEEGRFPKMLKLDFILRVGGVVTFFGGLFFIFFNFLFEREVV